jgi:hypothetical protein
MLDLSGFFAGVPDPRAANARHELSEILLIAPGCPGKLKHMPAPIGPGDIWALAWTD